MKFQSHQTDSTVYNQVLALLRSALWGEERFPYRAPQDIAWNKVHKELKQHGVQFFPITLLARENPSQSLQYISTDAKNILRWDKIMQEQQNLCFMLQDASIPCAIVKGATAAEHYPQPSSRPLGDIDILIDPAYFEQACSLVSSTADYFGENSRHKEYKRNEVFIELHNGFSTLWDVEKRILFDQRIFGAITNAETVNIDNYTFFRLPTIEHGLTLLEHIDIHLESGLGLRQILDWMMFVDKELTDALWHNEFAPFLKQINRENLAITVTRMCQMYLGLREDITWCANADESLCHELITYILGQGNFGVKNPKGSNRLVSVLGCRRNIFSFFRMLQNIGCQNWTVLKRYPFLRSFAWLHQLIRYIRCGLRTKHPVKFLKSAINRSKSQSDFLNALGVSRVAEEGQKRT